MATQDDIDRQVQAYYGGLEWDEGARLTSRSAQGRLEFERTQELIAERIRSGSRIADVGGATGVHAAALADAGHRVTLLDPVLEQVEQARSYGTFEALVGDARRLPFEEGNLAYRSSRTTSSRSVGDLRRVRHAVRDSPS